MNKKLWIGADIGGSHISAALVKGDGSIIGDSYCKDYVNASLSPFDIIRQWVAVLYKTMQHSEGKHTKGISIAMPGPFDYDKGISLIKGVNKYEKLYGIHLKHLLQNDRDLRNLPVFFENDAFCFGIGESITGEAASSNKIIAVTLGTGFGITFIKNNTVIKRAKDVPKDGYIFNAPYRDGIAEDYISARGLIKAYERSTGKKLNTVKELADLAKKGEKYALQTFENLGTDMAECLCKWIISFNPGYLIIGGSISKASSLFLPSFLKALTHHNIKIKIKISSQMELSAIAGAAFIAEKKSTHATNKTSYRKSSQPILPKQVPLLKQKPGEYNIYPFHHLKEKSIYNGYNTLANWVSTQKTVIIDGYAGIDWDMVQEKLSDELKEKNSKILWHNASAFLKPESNIEEMVQPFLGEKDSVWGKKTTLKMEDFFQAEELANLTPDTNCDITIVIGTGAALCNLNASVVYFDLPKNELQYRMRAKAITNLGTTKVYPDEQMYKRFYFVDRVVLNRHRLNTKQRITVIADGQWSTDVNWAFLKDISSGIAEIANNVLRVRPWFEAGAWGGQWMKNHIPQLHQEEVNYAWSFELIVPENGVVFESDGNLLEIAFDWLMEQEADRILGRDASRFGTEFPIRFDFLDTFDGGNLSIQCHPTLSYIREHFGENITQDETYYILDCKGDAGVYLGFQEDIEPEQFKEVLKISNKENKTVDIEKYVQRHIARKHDLFLIPNGTIHSAGVNNLVLEISATPYIFTFKMYDWLRPDLKGKPRPINIEHAFNNLNFERKGKKVPEELISKPKLLAQEADYKIIHLPTHPHHFYDVHRLEFASNLTIETNHQCHVLMLVEGVSIRVETEHGMNCRFNFAETFVIPAAAVSYTIFNEGENIAKVIKAFIK